jgi:hypothetical protein
MDEGANGEFQVDYWIPVVRDDALRADLLAIVRGIFSRVHLRHTLTYRI